MGKPRQSPNQGTVMGDADCRHKKTPPTEVDGVMRLKVGCADAHAEHRQQQYG
jgi:hypothetical protein